MNKRAFTLIEVIVSIVLLSLVIFTLYQNLDIVKLSNEQLKNHLQNSQEQIKLYKTLYLDIMSASDEFTISSKDNNFDKTCFYSTNSLYNLPRPYICYAINKNQNTLIRIETPNNSPSSINIGAFTKIDVLAKDMESFKIIKSNNKNKKILVYLKNKEFENAFLVDIVNSKIVFTINSI